MPIYEYQKNDISFFYNMLTHDINEINENYIERKYDTVVDGGVSYIVSGISFSVQLLCILVGSYFVIRGKITTGGLILAVQILNSVVTPINVVSTNRNLMNSTKPLREKIGELLIEHEQNGKTIEEGDIVLKNVCISFGNKKVLEGLNYNFKKNNSYIIIGESGSGKSTLAKLIAGFYSDFDGKILYNNTDIREIESNFIPDLVRYIGANTYVINDNLRENIRLYREYTDQEVDDVAKKVGFSKDMMSKSELGNGGKFISSGEYQRIAIASFSHWMFNTTNLYYYLVS